MTCRTSIGALWGVFTILRISNRVNMNKYVFEFRCFVD